MTSLRVGAAALNQTPLDWKGNQERVIAALRAARQADVDLLCLPELCIPGYGCEDAFHGTHVVQRSQEVLRAVLPHTQGLVAAIGLPVLYHHALFDCAVLVADGTPLGLVAKQHLAGDGIHYEPRWFKPWPEGVTAEVELCGRNVPIGDLQFEVGGVRIGFEICEDAWVAARPGARLAARGVDVILNPSASHFAFGKQSIRRRFVAEGARAFGATYVYGNLLGNEAGRAIYDGGVLIASGGKLVAQGPRLSMRPWHMTAATVDVAATRTQQTRIASFRPAFDDQGLVRAEWRWPGTRASLPEPPLAAWETGGHLKEEEFLRAETLGLWDYLRKSRSCGFVVSLSGGADSSAVAVLVALTLRRAVDELGLAGVHEALAYVPRIREAQDARALVGRLLTTLYQPTKNSSSTTRSAAATLAKALGAKHHEFELQPLVDAYQALVASAVGRELDWRRDDLALQNIQARARAPSAWMVANLEGKLLLTTSNRSEAAVGYTTMDGDTCGGLAPIAGIDKAYLRQWLEWMRAEGPTGSGGLGPIPELIQVTQQRSTPELRPADAKQLSEGDLMPFDVLDAIERLAIRDKLSPAEVLARLERDRPGVPRAELEGWVRRFFTLFARNQWKRERLAPAFHLDDENLDPKTWCRFPILSGGFEQELGELSK
jgi:NAD+ synthase (glutamine-hydrolysing)